VQPTWYKKIEPKIENTSAGTGLQREIITDQTSRSIGKSASNAKYVRAWR
jgi:hypothetical protein